MQVTDFHVNNILVRDVSNRLDLENNDGVRGDREMSTCEMMDVVWEADYEIRLSNRRRDASVEKDLSILLGLAAPVVTPPADAPRPRGYCRWIRAAGAWLNSKTDGSDSTAQAGAAATADNVPRFDNVPKQYEADLLARRAAARGAPDPSLSRGAQRRAVSLTQWGEVSAARDESRTARLRGDQYEVEVHKKWAISVACVVFAIVGIPMALRFPRGGMGLVIGGGLFVFSVYYVGLIAGEGLGNKHIVSPATAMWAPNVIFILGGLFGLYRVSRESGSTRGGDLADLWETLTGRFRRRRTA
jgi:lipopolysaccharide export system permease protein